MGLPRIDWLAEVFGLAGKVALVTGGGSGLGRAMALGLARAGAAVAVLDRSEEGALAAAREIAETGVRSLPLVADVRRREEVASAVRATITELGGLDVLVNSAGLSHVTPALAIDPDLAESVLDVNLVGTFWCCQEAGRHMVEQRGGSIVNIASIYGLVGQPQKAIYAASKGGVVQLTRALAVEWAPYNVRVNAIAPCVFETPMGSRIIAEAPEMYADVRARTPLGRFGKPEELMGAVVFLASPASTMVTGHVLAVDGGYTAL
ncbi:MAG TPA: glucose 1-dehydrogenase [Chloroflexota bacterium]